jgi:ribosomal protein S18 acetylase RimI-like enzyme
MNPVIKQCTPADLAALTEICRKTYRETFGPMNTPSNMESYLNRAFHTHKLQSELLNSRCIFYFLYADGEPAGYLKLNESSAQTDLNDPQSLEIERIYLARAFQGRGLGGLLLDTALDVAAGRNKSYLWLGVWEKNDKALAFYRKKGFYIIGTHPFLMGQEVQTDFLMRRDLSSGDGACV